MTCGECGAAIAQVSGKSGGYYGCLGAAKGACENKMLVRRTLVEKIILTALREHLSSPENVQHVLERVEEEVRKLYAHIPETLRMKETELASEERRLANFLDFIGDGRGSKALGEALLETERRVESLREELDGLRRGCDKVFQAPPVAWIDERLSQLRELLQRRTGKSALILRRLLGPIRLEPTRPDIGKPYYMAKSSIDTTALLDNSNVRDRPDDGSNSLRWWRRRESNPIRPLF